MISPYLGIIDGCTGLPHSTAWIAEGLTMNFSFMRETALDGAYIDVLQHTFSATRMNKRSQGHTRWNIGETLAESTRDEESWND